jgi:hypothetical protein
VPWGRAEAVEGSPEVRAFRVAEQGALALVLAMDQSFDDPSRTRKHPLLSLRSQLQPKSPPKRALLIEKG